MDATHERQNRHGSRLPLLHSMLVPRSILVRLPLSFQSFHPCHSFSRLLACCDPLRQSPQRPLLSILLSILLSTSLYPSLYPLLSSLFLPPLSHLPRPPLLLSTLETEISASLPTPKPPLCDHHFSRNILLSCSSRYPRRGHLHPDFCALPSVLEIPLVQREASATPGLSSNPNPALLFHAVRRRFLPSPGARLLMTCM
jgi:hypothetical protein